MPQIKNELIAVAQIKSNPHNVRTHSKKQIELIAKSIEQLGFYGSIILDEEYRLLAGHARVAAAKTLGLEKIPAVIVSGLSDVKKRLLLLNDNKLVERGGYDRKALAIELQQLSPLLAEAGLDFDLTGYEPVEIDTLFADHVDSENDPLDHVAPPSRTAVSCKGDVWLLHKHRLMCGDACQAADVGKLMVQERAALVITDPPFNRQIKQVQGRGKTKHPEFLKASGEMTSRQFTRFLRTALALAAQYSISGSIHFAFMDWRHVGELLAAGAKVYAELKNVIVWVKTNAGQGSFYRSQHEFIFVYKNGEGEHVNNFGLGKHGRNRSNVWTYAGVNTFKAGRMDELALHPTVKPVGLIADAMRDCSRRGDLVFDPFMGSGTTILAAERVGRRAYGLELDPRYVDVAIRRWQAYTKRDAVLAASSETFDEIARRSAASNKGAA